jgi:L-amino acid N-acyltransferase YncA
MRSRFKELSFKEFLGLLSDSVYQRDPLLVYGLDLKDLRPFQPAAAADTVIRRGEVSELRSFQTQVSPVPWELQCHDYDGIEDFFVAVGDGRLQHITWVYTSPHRNRLLRLGEGEAEFKFSLTLPEFRGRGLQPRVYTAISEYLAKRGFRRVFACVHEMNKPSIRGMEKAGFRELGKMTFRKILGIQISKKVHTSEIRLLP